LTPPPKGYGYEKTNRTSDNFFRGQPSEEEISFRLEQLEMRAGRYFMKKD